MTSEAPTATFPASAKTGKPRIVDITLSRGDFAAAAVLLSHIIYPGVGFPHEQNRLDAERAIGFEALKRRGHQRKWPPYKIAIPWPYLSQSDAERKRILRKVSTQLGKRLTAARMAQPLFLQNLAKQRSELGQRLVANGIPEPVREQFTAEQRLILVEGGRSVPLTIANLMEKHLEGAGETVNSNGQARAFRPSFPVLHMAVVLDMVLSHSRKLGHPSSIYDLPFAPGFAANMLLAAKEVAGLIALTPKLHALRASSSGFRAT